MGGDADGDVGPLFLLKCAEYHDYTGGGQPTPKKVLPVQHDGYLAGTGRAASQQLSVNQGGIQKTEADGGRGAAGEYIEGLSGYGRTL